LRGLLAAATSAAFFDDFLTSPFFLGAFLLAAAFIGTFFGVFLGI
jgi:hypothetical protein